MVRGGDDKDRELGPKKGGGGIRKPKNRTSVELGDQKPNKTTNENRNP